MIADDGFRCITPRSTVDHNPAPPESPNRFFGPTGCASSDQQANIAWSTGETVKPVRP